ncbi:DUF5977 domain-containing protein [Sphingobacterium siyangense]|uniref:DUF5977 domain-containing protein n=1 Tax=Sphingobacterium siyangense TaxID=459529 RepID=UPI0019623A3A|nr:DUF5977 domain-containing protein [Sphingobacterium siyangense]QRY56309.1 hypothetical protein JVX97_20135 [Sphingobacterium siyangense]
MKKTIKLRSMGLRILVRASYIISSFILLLSEQLSAQHNNQLNFVNIPPNPIAAKLPVFDKYEPNLSSGMVNVPIDIFNLKIGDYDMPIKLVYSTKGISIEDSPIPYGYGWALNLNPKVTRRVVGRKDEGFPFKDTYNSSNSNWGSRIPGGGGDYGDFYEPLKGIVKPDEGISYYQMQYSDFYDSQRDIFTLQLPNKSITFIILNINGVFEARPYGNNIKIQIITTSGQYPDIFGFKVIDEDGTEYIFGNNTGDTSYTFLENNDNVNVTWVLREITLINKQKIKFTWVENNVSSTKPSTNVPVTLNDNKSEDNGDGTASSPVVGDYGGIINLASYGNNYVKMLKTIEFSNGDVTFNYFTGLETMISSIEIKDATKTVISKATFTYGAKDGTMGYLLLQSLKVNTETYSFIYDANRFDKSSPKIDYWGFYNGKNNVNQIPKVNLNTYTNYSYVSESISPYGIPIGYADKTVDTAKMKAFMLQRVNLPTGGYVKYDYEPHQFNYTVSSPGFSDIPLVPNTGGGLRVKSIKFYNANGSLQFDKSYKYGKNENGLANIKLVPTLADFIDEHYIFSYYNSYNGNMPFIKTIASRSVAIKSLSDHSAYDFGNSSFWYDQVTEYSAGGKKTSYFEFKDDEIGKLEATKLFNKRFTTSVHTLFQNGPQIKREEIFKGNGASFDTVSIKDYVNEGYYYQGDLPIKNMLIDRKIRAIFVSGTSGGTDPIHPSNSSLFPIAYGGNFGFNVGTYYIYPYISRLTKETTTDFTVNGKVISSQTYEYSLTKPNTVIKTIQTASKLNETISTTFKFPWDFATTIAQAMVSQNVISYPLETETTKNTSKLLERNTFSNSLSVTNGLLLLNKKERLINSILSEQVQVTKFDSYGNPMEVVGLSGKKDTYLWGYSGNYLIAKLENTSNSEVQTALGIGYQSIIDNLNKATVMDSYIATVVNGLRTSLPYKLITSYTYRLLYGVSSKTDPGGKTEFYEYDSYGRLSTIKDYNGYIIKAFCYNYAGENVNCHPILTVYKNTALSKSFTRDCGTGYQGSTVSYTVPAGKYSSTISQQYADQMAQDDIDINGQNYANANGICNALAVNFYAYNFTAYPVTITFNPTFSGGTFTQISVPANSSYQVQIKAGNYYLDMNTAYNFNAAYMMSCGFYAFGPSASFQNVNISDSGCSSLDVDNYTP